MKLFGKIEMAAVLAVAMAGTVIAAGAPVGLGTAESFAVLAGATVTNTGPSTISGDVGVSPGSAITGFPPGTVSGGAVHAADALAAQAQVDLTTAYNDAAGRASTATVSADLAGQTLVSGVYTGGALGLTGTVTLDAQGDPLATFVFQAASTLITAPGSTVALVNGARACNVVWQVGSSVTIGTTTAFKGNILALTSIALQTGATLEGRALARNGEVTLDNNVITRASCAAAAATTAPTTAATTSRPAATVPPTDIVGSTGTTGGGAMLPLILVILWVIAVSLVGSIRSIRLAVVRSRSRD